jgi:hypothetical protein
VDALAGADGHGDEDQCLEVESERGRVQLGAVSADCAGALERAKPAMAGREAEPDPVGQLGDRQPAVALQLGKDLPVDVVHSHNASTTVVGPARSRKHMLRPRS